ncbi:DegV family EDD domain-containing protein [Natronospirillum operosum]|uniref:DegV family EDD domain-containing protein n=1 Tax=Natronospirillum operosum TaxID=2759953 RepID=A0A4Z0W8S8_9GAMM|nr:DegV family protein [Natronospirillum operosum]TGG93967.1 DegV family EDD domain-containing protein [Natronospirillum operosum]
MPRVAVVVDSVCALPPQFMRDFHIFQVPINISIDGEHFADPCDDQASLRLFRSGRLSRRHKVTTEAPSVAAFAGLLRQLIEQGYEHIWIQTLNRMQGLTYEQANQAAADVARQLEPPRKVFIRVMDSRTVFAGQALLAAEAVRRLQTDEDPVRMRRELDYMSSFVHTFVAPREPLVALERSRTRGERAVKWTQALVANTLGIHPILCIVNDQSYQVDRIRGFNNAAAGIFQHLQTRVETTHLLSPVVTVNYSGSLSELRELPGYASLEEACRVRHLQLIPAVAGLAGGIYGSVGSLMAAIATEPHEWEGR